MVDQIAFSKKTVTGTGTVNFTSSDITEAFSAAILLFSRTATDDSPVAGAMMGIGFIGATTGDQTDNTLQCAVGPGCEDNVTASAGGQTLRSQAQCVRIGNNALNVIVATAVYNSSIAGGVAIDFTYDASFTDSIIVTAILFAGLTDAAVGAALNIANAGTDVDVGTSTQEFEPDVVITVASDNTVNAGTANGVMALGFALNVDGIPQISAYTNYDNNTDPTDADGFYRDDACSCAFTGDRTVQQDRFSVTSFDSSGFQAASVDIPGGASESPQANFLALKFSGPFRIDCAHLSVAASTGIQNFTDFGFTPTFVLGMAHFLTTPNTITDGPAGSCGAYFATGIYGSRSVSYSMQEGLDLNPAVSVAKTYQGDHAVSCLEHGGTLSLQAEWAGGITNGFALNFTTAGQVGTLTALGIQLAPLPPLAPRRNRLPTKRSKRVRRPPALPQGKAAAEALPRFWRAIKRFRELMLRRLRKPKEFFPSGGAVFSDVVASPMADVYSAGSVRGTVEAGGAEAGDVF